MVVLAEVYRGTPADSMIDRLVNGVATTVGLDLRTARTAGQLRAQARRGSAVDAIVVATAVRLGGGVVATSDPDDLSALAADHPNVKVWSLNEPG
jgi:predicted nucleic acid-binding protein